MEVQHSWRKLEKVNQQLPFCLLDCNHHAAKLLLWVERSTWIFWFCSQHMLESKQNCSDWEKKMWKENLDMGSLALLVVSVPPLLDNFQMGSCWCASDWKVQTAIFYYAKVLDTPQKKGLMQLGVWMLTIPWAELPYDFCCGVWAAAAGQLNASDIADMMNSWIYEFMYMNSYV